MGKHDIIIIGAGIVGLATALKIKEKNPEIELAVLEKENDVAQHQTGNNSGVIHAGIYYKPGSLKALNCRKGYDMLIDFCNEYNIHYELCGKLIVATNEKELSALEELYKRGISNGLEKIKKISKEEIKDYEPNAAGIAAIHVPYTGIIDYKVVCDKYKEILVEKYSCEFYFNEKVRSIKDSDEEVIVKAKKNIFKAGKLINTAGLYSDKLAKETEKKLNIKIIPFRGEYYELKSDKSHLVNNLIYPVPDPAFPFLGVHFTRKINGSIESGPNAVFAFKKEGYKKSSFSFSEFFGSLFWPGFQKVMWKYWRVGIGEYYRSYNKSAFTKALQKLIPSIKKSDLKRGGAGVRAQACSRDGKLIDDFLIVQNSRVINVLNAPSPAATASLAIGEKIAEISFG